MHSILSRCATLFAILVLSVVCPLEGTLMGTADSNTRLLYEFCQAGYETTYPSGTQIADSTSSQHKATITGGALCREDEDGNVGLYITKTQWLTVPDTPDLQFADGSVTIEIWARLTKTCPTNGGCYIVLKKDSFGFPKYFQNSTGLYYYHQAAFHGTQVISISTASNVTGGIPSNLTGGIHHLVASVDGTSLSVYIDGSLAHQATLLFTPYPSFNDLIIGDDGGWGSHFEGYIYGIKIAREAYNATVVSQAYIKATTLRIPAWSTWSDWNCNVTCRLSGTQTRMRHCIGTTLKLPGGPTCNGTETTQTENCTVDKDCKARHHIYTKEQSPRVNTTALQELTTVENIGSLFDCAKHCIQNECSVFGFKQNADPIGNHQCCLANSETMIFTDQYDAPQEDMTGWSWHDRKITWH